MPPVERTHRFPILTLLTLATTAAFTATRLFGSGVLHALRRDPSGLRSGQVWRLVTPVLVQSDHSAIVVVEVFVLCAVVGVAGERAFSARRWITLYLVGALVGHGIGEVLQPREGGTSVAFVAILGALAANVLQPGSNAPRVRRVQAGLLVPLAIADTVVGDIHGLPFLGGVVVGAFWCRRDRKVSAPGRDRRS